MLNKIKDVYLSVTYSRQTLQLLMKYFSEFVPKNLPVMIDLNKIASSIEKEFYLTKHNDNYYGRSFDSALAESVVEDPSKEMLLSIELIKQKIISDFLYLDQGKQKDTVCKIASYMLKDPAVWRSEIPDV